MKKLIKKRNISKPIRGKVAVSSSKVSANKTGIVSLDKKPVKAERSSRISKPVSQAVAVKVQTGEGKRRAMLKSRGVETGC
jgi:hypothetical protein